MNSILFKSKQFLYNICKPSKRLTLILSLIVLLSFAFLCLNHFTTKKLIHTCALANDGMLTSMNVLNFKNGETMKLLRKLNDNPSTHHWMKRFYDQAVETNKISDELFLKIERIKNQIITNGGGISPITGQIDNLSNKRFATKILIKEGYADTIDQEINEAIEKYIMIIKRNRAINLEVFVKECLTLKNEKNIFSHKGLAGSFFYRLPNIAALAVLSKIQIDIRNTQSNILDATLNSIDSDDGDYFNRLFPVVNVISGRSAVSVGEKYEAEILLAAYDSKQQPEIFLAGKALEVRDGKAIYTGNTTNQGSYDFPGEIIVKNKSTGELTKYSYSLAYDVFSAPASITTAKSLVLYAGIENPISVSVPGYRPQDIIPIIEGGGTLKPDISPGSYIVTIPDNQSKTIKEVEIKVFVKTPSGRRKQIGNNITYIIKQVPIPIAYFGEKDGGEISIEELKLANHISVASNDLATDGLKYNVTKFRFVLATQKGIITFDGNGSVLSSQMKTAIANATKNDMVIISDIYASLSDRAAIRIPGAISFTIK